ncbi:unnamed protein product [Rotaria magnacalcarata]|uniref:MARVEL domain-containing protein n=1 Tax=Rotaria magnacalcarata TaxID=392030 RepID=A0A816Z6M6_9BILA|nr:unnamed protein product [Rotaria magnacalcarata]CAF2180928.1 unnamed protein product [Rotaria magnacalcarata]CAF4019175.1 unnamed protein product [Rotaria magnacalcarata]CAF4104993.1 unnamed protein product [Rotaria magnacalcarata]
MEYSTRPQRISCQYDYIRTIPGTLKAIQFLCDLVALILGATAPAISYSGHKGFFTFVAILAIIITTILFLLALINLQAVCIPDRWLLIEMFWCAFIALLFFIASIVVATIAKYNGVYGAAAFFGFAAFFTYLADAIYRFRLVRAGPRGRHTETYTSNTTTTTTTATRQQPTY